MGAPSTASFELTRESGSSPITGGSGGASGTGSGIAIAIPPCNGFGPCNIFIQLNQTQTAPSGPTGGGSGGDCNVVIPTVSSASTTTLELYTSFANGQCCSEFEHIKLGNLNECKTAVNGESIGAFWQANGDNQFGQDIHLQFFDSTDCSGTLAASPDLTNKAGCQLGGGWKSFMLSKTDGGSTTGGTGATCGAINQPTNSNVNDVTLALFSDTCCDSTPVETATLGTFNTCHQAIQAFQGFSQMAGADTFGKDAHVWAFTDQSCGGDTTKWEVQDLTNTPTCFIGPGDPTYWSFAIIGGSESAPGTFSTCDFTLPDNGGDDNTVTLELYSDDCCTSVETIKLGKTNECKQPNGGSFVGMAQAPGANMFGQGIKIWSYESDDCTGQATATELSHDAHCNVVSGKTYKSFQIGTGTFGGGDGSSSSGSSGTGTGTSPGGCPLPTVVSANTVNVGLYSDLVCCTNTEMANIGNLGECKETNGGSFTSISFAAGANEFGKSINVWAFSESGCGGTFIKIELKGTPFCESLFGDYQSFMVDTGTSTAGPTHNSGGATPPGGSSSSGSSGAGCSTHSQSVTSSDPNTVSMALYTAGNADCDPCNGWFSFAVTGVSGVLADFPDTNCFSGQGTPFSSAQWGIDGSGYPANAQVALYTSSDCSGSSITQAISSTGCAGDTLGLQFNSFNFIGGNDNSGGGGSTGNDNPCPNGPTGNGGSGYMSFGTMWVDINNGGASVEITEPEPDQCVSLTDPQYACWNDVVSSIQLITFVDVACTFWTDVGCSGDKIEFQTINGAPELRNLDGTEFNDAISSFLCFVGA